MSLILKNVSKSFVGKKAVDNISLELTKPGVYGLLGTNGAGKTTTIRMILGILKKDDGLITWNGKEVNRKSVNFGYLPEERGVYPKIKIYDQLMYFAELKGMDRKSADKSINKWAKELKVEEYLQMNPEKLSKGNQQKIQFISAIIHEPKLLILDEPFSGLDPLNVELFKKIILELKEKGTSIIFSSHRLDHVEYFCEKLVILVKGKSVLNGYLSKIKKDYKKKNIIIKGNIKKDEISKLEGVIDIIKQKDEYIVKISDEKYVSSIFKYISKYDNISKYCVEDASLDEIFVSIVGESYE